MPEEITLPESTTPDTDPTTPTTPPATATPPSTPTTPPPETPPPAQQTLTPEEAQRLQENLANLRQYEKQYKSQIAEQKKRLKAFEQQQATQATAEADAEKARLAEQEKWKELAEKTEAEKEELSQRFQALESQLIETQRRTIANRVAVSMNAINPDDINFANAVIDIDMSQPDAEAKIQAAIEAMAESHAYLFKPPEPEEPEKPAMPGLPGFNPAGDGAQMTDAQRIARLRQLTGQGHWGMFDTKT
jgi:hypothetical protein